MEWQNVTMNIEKLKIVKNKSLPRLKIGSTQRYKEVSPNKVTAVEVKCLQSSEYSSDSPRLVPTAWSQIDKIPDCTKQVEDAIAAIDICHTGV